MKKKLYLEKIEQSGEIDGSSYFFKTPNDANIKFYNSERALRIKVNYNIRKEKFEFKSGDDYYSLSTEDIESIAFSPPVFIIGFVGKKGASCFATHIGPTPGPPPP